MSSKKFSIVREIDISELNKKITECIDPYIFMNKETFSELKNKFKLYGLWREYKNRWK